MAPPPRAPLVLLLAIAATAAVTAAPSCAKYRLQWMYVLEDGTPMDAVIAANDKFVLRDCTTAVGRGDGAALSHSRGEYGVTTATPGVQFADFGGYLDFATLADLKTCFGNGAKSGSLAAIRKFAKQASRVVYELPTCTPRATAPATLRFMFNYKLSSPATCKKAVGLQAKIAEGPGAVRHANGCDALNGDTTAFGAANLPISANYGGYVDFKSVPEMTAFLSSATTKPDVKAAWADVHKLGTVMRMAVPLTPANAKVAKERGAITP